MHRGASKCPHLDLFTCHLVSCHLSWFCCQEVVDYIISDIWPDLKAGLVLTGNITGAVIFMFSLQ